MLQRRCVLVSVVCLAMWLLIGAGCAPSVVRRSLDVCPGKASVEAALGALSSRADKAVSLRAMGRCTLTYQTEKGREKDQGVALRLYLNPPYEVYLQGSIAADGKAIVMGANEQEFWLALRPKQVSSYYWGSWSELGYGQGLMISPKVVLEALGVVAESVSGQSQETWTIKHKRGYDILEKRDASGTIRKRVHVYACEYEAHKIEYFDDSGRPIVTVELDGYEVAVEQFAVPRSIRVTTWDGRKVESDIKIELNSIRAMEFTGRRKEIFERQPPRGFQNIYRVVGDAIIEQPS